MNTFTMNADSSPAPAGLICYACGCRTLAVIHLRRRSWIIKRCGRVLVTEGGTREFTARAGQMVGRHYNGTTRTTFRPVEWILTRLKHDANAITIRNTEVDPGRLRIDMSGHKFEIHQFEKGLPPTFQAWPGQIHFRGTEARK
ncbi:hypothetical protein M3D01_004075 [Micrococcus luteus]|nr:hypothetical protein [Micrococcus luteus]